jgi:ubiquinone/menaquinone biosynthesis C-methylase UbiE
MELQRGCDPRILREQEYADDSHLDVRYRTHQLYTLDPVDFGRWTLERLEWQGDERVLDVGCGPGDLLRQMARGRPDWRAPVGLDLSAGMVAQAMERTREQEVRFLVADAQSVPFPDETFDVVMARHMLYHVPDINRAVSEAARVLRPHGRFLVTTNSAHTMPEYQALMEGATRRFPGMERRERITDRFSLENASAFLEPDFDALKAHILRGTLRFPSAQPLLEYLASHRSMIMRDDHTHREWEAVLEFVRIEAESVITCAGHFDVSKITGALVGVRRK